MPPMPDPLALHQRSQGRKVKVNHHHGLLAAARTYALTPAFTQPYRQHRGDWGD